MARLIKKLHVGDGDVIALKFQSNLANKETIELIANALNRMGLEQSLVVVVEDFGDLSVLNETEMNKRGWYRLSKISKVLKIPEKT